MVFHNCSLSILDLPRRKTLTECEDFQNVCTANRSDIGPGLPSHARISILDALRTGALQATLARPSVAGTSDLCSDLFFFDGLHT